MTTSLQTDAESERLTISTPILLKVPIVLQPQVIQKSYGCEVVVPILLKIPIALQIEILTKSLRCNTQKLNLKMISTESVQSESVQEATEELSESVQASTDTSLISEPAIAIEIQSNVQSNVQSNIQSNIQLPPPQFKRRKLRKLNFKLDHHYPMTVLTILLGALLGVGCSSVLVNHLLELEASQNRAPTHAALTLPLHVSP